jgi:dihydrodipicolinate synthase/N-acetylneuraminate lyase
MLLEGIYLPLTTPFYPDERLNLRKLEHNVGRYSLTPAAGLMIAGTIGEGSGLTAGEVKEAFQAAIGAAANEKVMLAGVGRDSLFATLDLAEAAARLSYDAVVVGAPALALGPLELTTYLQTVADRAGLPVVLLSEPGRELAVKTIAALAGHSGVIGLIDHAAVGERLGAILNATSEVSREVAVTTVFAAATGRMLAEREAGSGSFVSAESLGGGTAVAVMTPTPALKTRMKRVGFQVLAGSTAAMLDGLAGGAVGAVPRFGVCAPQACCEVYQAWRDDDLLLASEKQQRIAGVAARMEGPQGIAAIKYGADLNGYFGGRPRLPLLGLTAQAKEEIERAMSGLRN